MKAISVGKKMYISMLLFFALLSLAANVQAEAEILAKVGSVQITKYELNREMSRILPMNANFHGSVSEEKVAEVREKALNNLIEQAYKVQYAMANELSVTSAELDKRLEGVRKNFKTDEELQKALGGEKIVDFRASVFRLLLAAKAEDLVVGSKSKVSAQEIEKFYTDRKNMYKRPKRYRVSHVLVRVDPTLVGEDRVKLLVKAEDLTERALAGEDFYNLAYYNSDEDSKYVGGDIGYFHSGQVVREFEDAIKDLKPGDIVGPVETLSGYHIIKLTEVEESRVLRFDEVKEKIGKELGDKRRESLYEEWMTELKKQYPVEVYL